ncbi:MAG: HAD family acid phosphatase [Gemmatimonadaceae bacterium]
MRSKIVLSVAVVFVTSACAPQRVASPAATPAPAAAPATGPQLSNDVKWVRMSAEYRALARQAFAFASERLPELARGLPAQGWAVILDADETVLDNSEYQRRLELSSAPFDEKGWEKWVNERAAPAIAGAIEFTTLVHTRGGRVVIVTNRSQGACDATRENIKSAGIQADAVLCQPAGERDKNPRFERVQKGTAVPGLPRLAVVAWVGDNILDFPALAQATRDDSTALGEFGKRFFIIPNPMYGSWEHLK